MSAEETPEAGAVYTGPLLIVISGPSGAGKDAVRDELRARHSKTLYSVVTVTTRPRRADEQDGVHYHFLSDDAFRRLLREGGFIEYERYDETLRGSPRAEVEEALAAGKDVILRMDVRGARTIKRLAPEAVLIFVRPPSLEALRQRMLRRGSETPESLERRLAIAMEELAQLSAFDYAVLNEEGELGRAVEEVEAIMTAERCRIGRRQVVVGGLIPE